MSEKCLELKTTPLYEKHISSGAKMVPFSGWNMPVQYTGIIDEHMQTRTKAGLFDICHMGEFFLKGPRAEKALNRLVTCRLEDLPAGRCKYGFLLNDNGGVVDDLIVFKISAEEFMLVVNAGCIEKDRGWIKYNISGDVDFTDESEKTAKLDLQGPLSVDVMRRLISDEVASGIKRYGFKYVDINGVEVILSGTGYTGEAGYELFFDVSYAGKMWDMLNAFDDVKPVGLGARDTLRMEMGFSLYGHELDEKHTPVESNLERFVFMDKGFIGKDAILRQQNKGAKKILKGFICDGRRSARDHFSVMSDGAVVGEVTSGTFSPCMKKGIGLCYIDISLAEEGREITLTDGKVEIAARIRDLPLYRK